MSFVDVATIDLISAIIAVATLAYVLMRIRRKTQTRALRVLKVAQLLSIVVLAALLIFTLPSIDRTFRIARCADGLHMLASWDAGEVSHNPWHWDSYLLTPEWAEWLLVNTEFSYSCSWELFDGLPLIYLSIAHRSLVGGDNGGDDRSLRLLAHFIKRGADLNEYVSGYTLVHWAIMEEDLEALQLLIHAGADPTLRIDREAKDFDNLDAFEYSAYMYESRGDDFRELFKYMQSIQR